MCTDRISPVLDDILGCVTAAFDDCEDTFGFCRSGVVAGVPAWDDCCDCGRGEGQLWVRVADWTPDPEFTQPGVSKCAQTTLVTVGIGALRCVPTLSETGEAPSAAEEAVAAYKIYLDAQVIHSAVMCCVTERVWQGWTPLGFDGGCGGGEHLFQVPLAPCVCEDVES